MDTMDTFTKNVAKFISVLILFTVISGATPQTADAASLAFVKQSNYSYSAPAGFFTGVYHGLIAPYSLIARLFLPGIDMYAAANVGWVYDLGFLIGILFSVPAGWLFALIALLATIF
jgi:hypothetical protein